VRVVNVRIVMENLLRNSWKYTSHHERAPIEFGRTIARGRSAFFVKDDGSGFDNRAADRLFQPFRDSTLLPSFLVTESGWQPSDASFNAMEEKFGAKVLWRKAPQSTLRSALNQADLLAKASDTAIKCKGIRDSEMPPKTANRILSGPGPFVGEIACCRR